MNVKKLRDAHTAPVSTNGVGHLDTMSCFTQGSPCVPVGLADRSSSTTVEDLTWSLYGTGRGGPRVTRGHLSRAQSIGNHIVEVISAML